MKWFQIQRGVRPRLACELSGGAVVCARSESADGPIVSAARAELPEGAVVPGPRAGNILERMAVVVAMRRAMEGVGARPNRTRTELTLVVPDAAVRVLLLEFDALPDKLTEALPLIRFRLKKLLPFDADAATVSYQVMSQTRSLTRVLAVAIPREVLVEYESVVREAGFEPGVVLPSTLAALAGMSRAEEMGTDAPAALVVNASQQGVTTAIVRQGVVLLHRSVDLVEHGFALEVPAAVEEIPALPAELFQGAAREPLSLVNADETVEEWAAQEPLPEHGRNPYAEPAPVGHSPYAGPTVLADLNAEVHDAILNAPTVPGTLIDPVVVKELRARRAGAEPSRTEDNDPTVYTMEPDVLADEMVRSISVAMAYFEDTLAHAPGVVLSAGPFGAEQLRRVLEKQGVPEIEGVSVRELVDPQGVGAATGVSLGELTGVVGALRG